MAPPSPPPPPMRRPLPQPVEESSRSSRNPGASSRNKTSSTTKIDPTKPRRPLPQPVEVSSQTSKQKDASAKAKMGDGSRDSVGVTSSAAKPLPQRLDAPTTSDSPSPKPRKFAPQMIETSRRSRRNSRPDASATDITPSASPAPVDSPTELSKISPLTRQHPEPKPPESSPLSDSDQLPHAPESRFSSSRLAEKAPRRHSFRVPDLPVILSTSESNDSSSSSAEADHQPGSGLWRRKKAANKRGSQARESQDESTSGYLLSLAAKAAETQLKEQVMAAYPNEHLHEPVDHYAGDRDSDGDSDVDTGVGQLSMGKDGCVEVDDEEEEEEEEDRAAHRSKLRQHRDSGLEEGGWGLAELRKHRDKLEQQEREAWESQSSEQIRLSDIGAGDPNAEFRQRGANAANRAPMADAASKPWQTHNELQSMAKAASPPMAGQALHFPRCHSPCNTRLDVHQYPGQQEHTKEDTKEQSGLWTPKGGNTSQSSQSGLWMGVNAASAQDRLTAPMFMPSGLMTPAVEQGDPFSPVGSIAPSRNNSYVPASSLPPSPPSSQEEGGGAQQTAKRVCVTRGKSSTQLEDELDDMFVTQVYNYLSLGYPALARPYDDELAKIAQTDVATLRKDDHNGNSKGYVGAPEGTGLDVRGCRDGACERWLALKRYVKEWGRQQSLLRGAGGPGWEKSELANDQGGWGARARKGSWAI